MKGLFIDYNNFSHLFIKLISGFIHLQMNTVLSEIQDWTTKYLRKFENLTNTLAVNEPTRQ
jgi:hypothetical protein